MPPPRHPNSASSSATVAPFSAARVAPTLRSADYLPRGFTISAGSLAQDRRWLFHPCFATRLGGVSGGRETQGGRDSSHTLMVGAGEVGSAQLPVARATCPGKPSTSP